MHEPLGAGEKARWLGAEVAVRGAQPEARLLRVAAHQRVEAAEDPDEEQRVAPFRGGGIHRPVAGEGARDAGRAGAENSGQLRLADAQRRRGADQALGEDGGGGSGWSFDGAHVSDEIYRGFLANATRRHAVTGG